VKKDILLFLGINGMYFKLAIEIGIFDFYRLFFRPLIKAHFFDQAKVEKLGVVGSGHCLISEGMKMITWKVIALKTETDPFLSCTTEYFTRCAVSQESDGPFGISASFAS
jgi:hypothetical protein